MLRYPCLVLDHDDTVVRSEETLNYPAFLAALDRFRPGETITKQEYTRGCFSPGFLAFCQERYRFTQEELDEEYLLWQSFVRDKIAPLYDGIGRLIALSVPEGTGEEDGKKALAAFQSHYILNCNNKTRPYDGILELLRRARSLGCKTAIVSNKVDAAVKRLTERYFDGLIDVAIGESENIRRKPWPDTVRKALEELQTDPGSAVYIGDSEVDVATAYNADLPCLSVSGGFRSKEELIEAGAELIVDRPEEILRFLELD